MSIKYVLTWSSGQESHCYGAANIIAAFTNGINRGEGSATLSVADLSPPLEDGVALRHVMRGCCDGADPVGCYERGIQEAIDKANEDAAERRGAKV